MLSNSSDCLKAVLVISLRRELLFSLFRAVRLQTTSAVDRSRTTRFPPLPFALSVALVHALLSALSPRSFSRTCARFLAPLEKLRSREGSRDSNMRYAPPGTGCIVTSRTQQRAEREDRSRTTSSPSLFLALSHALFPALFAALLHALLSALLSRSFFPALVRGFRVLKEERSGQNGGRLDIEYARQSAQRLMTSREYEAKSEREWAKNDGGARGQEVRTQERQRATKRGHRERGRARE